MPPAKFRSHKCKLLSQQIVKDTEAMNKDPCLTTADIYVQILVQGWVFPSLLEFTSVPRSVKQQQQRLQEHQGQAF